MNMALVVDMAFNLQYSLSSDSDVETTFKQDSIDLDWIDLVNKGKNPDICLYFNLEDNK